MGKNAALAAAGIISASKPQQITAMMCRFISALLCSSLLFVSVSLTGCGQKKYTSPEAVFEAARSAVADEDMEGFVNCLTPESQYLFSGMLVLVGSMMMDFAAFAGDDADAAEAVSNMEKVFEKHGLTEHGWLTEDVMKEMEEADESDSTAAMEKLAEPIKDKAAFMADMLEAFKGLDNEGGSPADQFKGTLKDIKIDGDSASAVLEDGGNTEPIQFKKVKGSWLIHLDPEEFGGGFLGN